MAFVLLTTSMHKLSISPYRDIRIVRGNYELAERLPVQ